MEKTNDNKKTYNLKVQDFTPFFGQFFFVSRNYKNLPKDQHRPQPCKEFKDTGLYLTGLNTLTGIIPSYIIINKVLEALVK